MTPFTLVAVAFVLALLLFGFAFWTPIYAVPLALVFLAAMGLAQRARAHRSSDEWLSERRKAARSGPGGHQTGLTDSDRETLYDRR